MLKKKVTNQNEQIKPSFTRISDGPFDINVIMAAVRYEYEALAVSAGMLVMQAVIEAERDH